MNQKVGIDSNNLTYIIEAIDPKYNPQEDRLAEEKKALLRAYLYKGITYYIGPTVESEYEKIKENGKYLAHVSFCDSLLNNGPWNLSSSSVKQKVDEFFKAPPDQEDCYVLAEAEEMGLDILLTNDKNFLKRLRPLSSFVKIMKPSEFWSSQKVPQGSSPLFKPADTNPLIQQTWWYL